MASLVLGVLLFALAAPALRAPLFDGWQRLAPRDLSDTPVRVVLIDDASEAKLGRWPWPRYYTARLVEQIARQQPSVIGLDMLFLEPDRNDPANFVAMYPELAPAARREVEALPSLDGVLAAAIANAPVVLGMAGIVSTPGPPDPDDGGSFSAPLPNDVAVFAQSVRSIGELSDVALGLGFLNGAPDDDGTLRSLPAAARIASIDRPAFAVELARIHAGGQPIGLSIDNARLTGLTIGRQNVSTDGAGRLRPHFGRLPENATISALDLLDGSLADGTLKDKIVIVGVAGVGSNDIATTPIEPRVFGAQVQGQIADAILNGATLARPAWLSWIEWSGGLALAVAAMLLAPRLSRGWAIGLPLLVAASLFAVSWLAFRQCGVLFDPVLPTGLFLLSVAAMVLARFSETARARAHIHRAFDRYLSPELVARIARDPAQLELGGEERDMTVLFCDVRGFSALSETMTPNQIIQFLIGLLTPMTDILIDHRATIDKYIGDAILAFWNAPLDDPDHADSAARAALAMVAKLKELNVNMPDQDRYPWPGQVRLGIGLNCGPICVGNMGSERRLSYSIIGDTVNLASRIEGLTKFYGVEIAIGEALATRLIGFATIPLDCVRVVGRATPETVHALLGDETDARDPAFIALRNGVDTMRAAYAERRWDDADAARDRLAGLDKAGKLAGLHALYGTRIATFRTAPPPDDWDGVFAASEK